MRQRMQAAAFRQFEFLCDRAFICITSGRRQPSRKAYVLCLHQSIQRSPTHKWALQVAAAAAQVLRAMTAEPATLAQLVEARKEAVAGLLIAAMSRDHTAQSCALEALINLGQVTHAAPLLIGFAVWDRELQSSSLSRCELTASIRLCAGGESC